MSVCIECDECGRDTYKNFNIYCEVCYDRLGDKIKDLQFENQDINGQNERLRLEVEVLKEENADLIRENADLNRKLQNALAL